MPHDDRLDEVNEQDGRRNTYRPYYNPLHPKPVEATEYSHDNPTSTLFLATPLHAPLLFTNSDSDCRDNCANERTFLSYLRLAIYMAVVSVAIVISFHLQHQPSKLELHMALPLGITFWVLSLLCLLLGFGNYVKTVGKFSRRAAIVQTGWKTQAGVGLIALSIVGVCVLFLATKTTKSGA